MVSHMVPRLVAAFNSCVSLLVGQQNNSPCRFIFARQDIAAERENGLFRSIDATEVNVLSVSLIFDRLINDW